LKRSLGLEVWKCFLVYQIHHISGIDLVPDPADRQYVQGGEEPVDCQMERLSNHPWQVPWIGFRNNHFGGASKLLFPFCAGLVLKLSFFVFFRWVNQVRFRSISHFFGQVGHTHNVVDQRLSVAVTSFQNEKVIETPQEWVCIKNIYIYLLGSPPNIQVFPDRIHPGN